MSLEADKAMQSTLKSLWQRAKEAYKGDCVPGSRLYNPARKLPDIQQAYRDADEELLILSGTEARIVHDAPVGWLSLHRRY